ncbi:serine/threonine-protein phosphatase 7 long form homolog [Abrus precatorius]|uniref:Serine/threonine-protein phosphatase 7 long form homolog n=1 Tax=Abrus precatorius TaxID=3816 RepID=A0A8B8M7E5_ABRPR|nr:serine/threonine-protein phosphatase 7 long form homolog [Abrus precatorius]
MTSSSGQNRVINLGSEDSSLFRFQSFHVSKHIWDGRDHPMLRVRKSQNIPGRLEGVSQKIIPHLEPKTHTFHLPPGEYTITLQDVAILLGLRIDGRPVIAPTGGPDAFVGSFLKMSWLDEHFNHIGMHNQNVVQITQFAKAYILMLIGGFMLPDHSSSRVSLCMTTNIDRVTIGGLVALIVMWAWDRFPHLAPSNPPHTRVNLSYGVRWLSHGTRKGKKDVQSYRYILDRLTRDEIVWVPYSMKLINMLPPIYRDSMDLWRVVVPLICFQSISFLMRVDFGRPLLLALSTSGINFYPPFITILQSFSSGFYYEEYAFTTYCIE